VKFVDTNKALPADLVPDVIAANLGFSTNSVSPYHLLTCLLFFLYLPDFVCIKCICFFHQDSSWPGLLRVSPFNSARLAVIFALDGPWARLPGEVAKYAVSKHRYQLLPVAGEGPNSWWMQLKHIASQRMMIKASAKQIALNEEQVRIKRYKKILSQ
jgi:hypothetical protein